MGGWAGDQEVATTKHLAQEACNNFCLDIDMQDAVVPGLPRGYLVIPYKPKDNESEQTMYSQITQAIQQVRQVNQPTGVITPSGQPRHSWLSFSQTPERRRRARFAGKVKRLLLRKGHLQVELATGKLDTKDAKWQAQQPHQYKGRHWRGARWGG